MGELARVQGPLRPKRFSVELPIDYRLRTWARWHHGRTENISCNGVLFLSRQKLEPFSPIEFRLRLPEELTGAGEVTLLCAGYVVRQLGEGAPERPRIAATFLGYELADGVQGEDQLRAAYRRMFRRDMAGLSHKLNNLLAVIVGHADLMLSEGADTRRCALQIRQAAQSASQFLKEFLKKSA